MPKMKHPPSHRVAVFAVIFDEHGRVLLSRRADSGWWNLPGGGLEPHESVGEGLVREVREETGLAIVPDRLVGVYSKPQKAEVVLVFEARVSGGELCPTQESDQHQWLDPQALPRVQLQLLPKHRERIEDACLRREQALVKDQREPPVWAAESEQGEGRSRRGEDAYPQTWRQRP